MPLGDRTGPRSLGPRTGRGLGYCSGSPAPSYTNGWGGPGGGFGRGGWAGRFGRGYRRGVGWGYGAVCAPPSYNADPQARESALRARADELKVALENIQSELDSLSNSGTD